MEKKDSSEKSVLKELGPYMNLGIQLIIPIILGVFGGKWLDEEYDTKPLWIVTLSVLGIIIGLYSFIKTVIKENDKLKK